MVLCISWVSKKNPPLFPNVEKQGGIFAKCLKIQLSAGQNVEKQGGIVIFARNSTDYHIFEATNEQILANLIWENDFVGHKTFYPTKSCSDY